jgi:hypothetical protein
MDKVPIQNIRGDPYLARKINELVDQVNALAALETVPPLQHDLGPHGLSLWLEERERSPAPVDDADLAPDDYFSFPTMTVAGPPTWAPLEGEYPVQIDSGAVLWWWAGSSWVTVGGGGHTIQDEGTPLAARPTLNFTGAGVTATDDGANNRINVTIPGGGGGALTIEEVDGAPTAAYAPISTLRFHSGDGFDVSQPAAGIARLDLLAANGTFQAGVVSTVAQEFGGLKAFPAGLVLGSYAATTADAFGVLKPGPNFQVNLWVRNDARLAKGTVLTLECDSPGDRLLISPYDALGAGFVRYSIRRDNVVYDGLYGTDGIGNVFKGGICTTIGTGGGGGGLAIQDEGIALTARPALNFVGAGVTAADDAANNRTNVTIPGGGGGVVTGIADTDSIDLSLSGGTSGTLSGVTKQQMSITNGPGGLKLVNDTVAPTINSKFYGADASGNRGWYALPAGGAGAVTGCDLWNSANQSIPNSLWTTINFNTERFDTSNLHSTSVNPGRITIPPGLGGKWLVGAAIALTGTPSGSVRGTRFLVNNTLVALSTLFVPVGSFAAGGTIVKLFTFADGDFLVVQAYHDGTGISSIGGGANPILWAVRIGS